jgi:hypothetical protein
MKIGIVSYFFPPLQNPRSFRAFELGRQFSKMGHDVNIYVPDTGYAYDEMETAYGFSVIRVKPGFYLNKPGRSGATSGPSSAENAAAPQSRKSILKKLKRKLVEWFYPGGFNFEFSFTGRRKLLDDRKEFDLLLSIGLPLCSHLAVSLARKNRPSIAALCIADYGDPYSFSTIIQPPYFHRWLERRMLKRFDYILTPTPNAVPAYSYFKPESQIKVIPQGFDFSEVKVAAKENGKGGPVRIVFAGNFYHRIREPHELFEHLLSVKRDFVLVLYINTGDPDNLSLIAPYREKLGDRLEVHPFLPRLDCIYEMSKADFLVNVSNTEIAHSPSKLIDYCLSKRPVFSYVPGQFDASVFDRFLSGDYSEDASREIDISDFDIRQVANRITDLVAEKNRR